MTFLGTEPIEVLRFPELTAWCTTCRWAARATRWPIRLSSSPILRGPRAEIVLQLHDPGLTGLARSLAILAATPAVDGVVLSRMP